MIRRHRDHHIADQRPQKYFQISKAARLVYNERSALPCTRAWMKLEGIILNEISQAEKDEYCLVGSCRNRE